MAFITTNNLREAHPLAAYKSKLTRLASDLSVLLERAPAVNHTKHDGVARARSRDSRRVRRSRLPTLQRMRGLTRSSFRCARTWPQNIAFVRILGT